MPEDRQQSADNNHRLRELSVTVEEVVGDDSPDIAKNGELVFNPGIPEMLLDETVYLLLRVPSRVFDTIEQAADSSATKFSLYVHLKCWHWAGLYGDSYLYIDKENPGQAEWTAITTSRIFEDLTANQLTGVPRFASDAPVSHDVNVNSYERLGKIEAHMQALRKTVTLSLIGIFLWLIVNTFIV